MKKIDVADRYLINLNNIYQGIIDRSISEKKQDDKTQKNLVIAIGSNRGLCSTFNHDVVNAYLNMSNELKEEIQLIVIGERLQKIFEKKKISILHYEAFPNASDLNVKFTQTMLTNFFIGAGLNRILLFNQYRGAGKYQTIQSPIFPNEFLRTLPSRKSLEGFVFDTEPEKLISFLFENLLYASFYYALLLSAASEHSTRFQLMESASSNAKDLSEELTIEVQNLRRQKITSEMQELAVAAGLLKEIR